MSALLWNLALGLAWTAITGSFTVANFGLGVAVGFVALMLTQRVPGFPRYSRRWWHVLTLALYTLREIVMANLRVSRDILAGERMRPALLSVPIESKTDTEITLLAAFVTLTPGTTVIDISPDSQHLLVHFTNVPEDGLEEARASVLNGFERRILQVLR